MARGADAFNRRWLAGLVMARQKFGISRQCESAEGIYRCIKMAPGQHDLTKLCFIEPTVNFHAEPSHGEQDGQPKEPNHRGSSIEYDELPPSVRFCWGVNPQIQGGWRTSALIRIPDSSRTSREVSKVP